MFLVVITVVADSFFFGVRTMANYYYQLDFFIKPALTPVFEKYFALVIKAHKKHAPEQGKKLKLMRTFIGGKDSISFILPLESLSDLEKWGHTPAVIMAHYGEEAGLEILKSYCASMESWQSKITKPFLI